MMSGVRSVFMQRAIVFLALGLLPGGYVAAQEPRVVLELATEPGLSPLKAQDWGRTLQGVDGVTLRIRAGNRAETIGARSTGAGFHVNGAVLSDGTLKLPGATFRTGDRAGVIAWIKKLGAGDEAAEGKRSAFGLKPEELVEVHKALAAKISISTKTLPVQEVVEQLGSAVPYKLTIDRSAAAALAAVEPASEELQNLASGTALAAVVRPAGLVMTVERTAGGQLQLRIADSREVKEHWPVGWPSPKPNKDTLPDLYKFLNVEVNDTPLLESLEAVRGRLNVPMLIDQNSLAREGIEIEKVKVTVKRANTFYAKILDRLLFQAKLKYEVRVDEADQPFLWITTLR